MTNTSENATPRILNSKPADSSSKIIFEDNILCSQFLRDYIDLPYMKEIKPEDIEDVSDQYVPLFSEERNADRVKKVHIKNEKPFFLVSLIEHKSKIDYNVSMQIFRYMVYIWEAYAKEAEKMRKGITKLADFKYPPILPIVYYEGSGNWTVPLDFKSRIMEGDSFSRFLPNFEYYLIPLREYSNEELLAKKDEISLVMMINRMQNEKDIEEFQNLPAEEVEIILKETPEHLLNIISEVLRAFLLKMNVSVTKTEELVGKVKEKKMGILFENVEPFDIEKAKRWAEEQERRAEEQKRRAEEQERRAEEQKRRAEEQERRAEEQKCRAEEQERRAEEQERRAEEQERRAEEEKQRADRAEERAIQLFVEAYQEISGSKESTLQKVMEKFRLDEEKATIKMSLYWKNQTS